MQLSVLPALLLASALLTPVPAQVAALKRAVADAEARAVRTGVAVCDADGAVLYRHRASEAFVPASNMKLLTAAGVLHGLGQDFAFCTVFRVVDGELLVTASGDPNLLHGTEHDPVTVFGHVARELRSRDIHSLRSVRLLAGTFTGPTRPPTWPQDQLHTYYCAPTSGFVLEQGTFVMSIQRSGGRNALVQLVAPPSGYAIKGSIAEVTSRKGATYGAIDLGGGLKVRGKFYRKSPRVEIPTSVKDPVRWYRDTLIHRLAAGGIHVVADAKATSPGVVYEHRSRLQPALRRMLEDSSNFDAEQCVRVLGAIKNNDGSLEGGRTALAQQVKKLVGSMPAGVVITDGSGLSKQNRVTPGLLVVAMFQSFGGADGAVLRDSLAVSGRTGTLSKRFHGSDLVGRVRAKTGWIRGASSLSGLVEMPNGNRRWFSILMNYERKRNGVNKDLKRIQETIVRAVAGIAANG
ncbi:MAG: D-alanyl-D-alanine carboxypeptidase/D-alanyl-D-alanine-endopeptidase (penicillin-binding protein 4) [Planctomycetota bacterium]|jgi:D-alanyl-D-alanine carboxypeptidase/D-alanyl-D-alanine-endopeptidase (penicillin-binding protein 4)